MRLNHGASRVNLLSVLFSFKGRINRLQYWLGCTAAFLILFLAVIIAGALIGPMPTNYGKPSPEFLTQFLRALGISAAILVPMSLLACWCSLAVQVKRLHDRGRSGYLVLIQFVPVILVIINISNPTALSIGGPVALMWLVNLIFFVDLCCLPGVEGPNRFGDPPGTSSPRREVKVREAAFTLGGAQSAMERAIAEQQTRPAAPRPALPRATMPAPAPASSGGFGQRAPRAS